MTKLPPMLTVEEAAWLMRIGRTKAYAMAKQWRQTGGQCGLPVVDLDGVLRVPLLKLQELTGVDFSHWDLTTSDGETATHELRRHGGTPHHNATPPARRRGRAKRGQLDMFGPPSPSY